MSIPVFNSIGVLPLGIYEASLEEIKDKFCSLENADYREELYNSLVKYIKVINTHDVQKKIYIDGSFVTNKKFPSDIDVLLFYDYEYHNNEWLELLSDVVISVKFKGIQLLPGFLDSYKEDGILEFAQEVKDMPGHKKGLIRVIL